MQTGDLVLSQLEVLDKQTTDLVAYARKSAPDGWSHEELETVDALLNNIHRQAMSCLTAIGEAVKQARAARVS